MSDEVVTTPFGKFLVNDRDLIESTLKASTLWDGPGFLQVIAKEHARFGERGTTILDIGANIGSFSIYCAAQGAWRVIAIEPIPFTMQRLKANLDLNQKVCAAVVIPLEVAAYSYETRLRMLDFDEHNMGATALVQRGESASGIQGSALDHYAHLYGDAVSLIKVDAQGCDGAALFGLQITIAADHPAIVFEWEADLAARHPYSLEDVRIMLKRNGYTIQPWPSQPNNYLATVAR